MSGEQPEGTGTSQEAAPGGAARKTKEKRAGDKHRRSHAERALASLRAAKRGQREISGGAERARFLLAEANVLALLEVADALAAPAGGSESANDEEPAASD